MQILKVKKLNPNAKLPTKERVSDSGYDLYSLSNHSIAPFQTVVVPTGIAFGIPQGFEVQVRPRSGVSVKTSLKVILGTVDNAYTGDVGIMVQNLSKDIVDIPIGYKLAQAVLTPIPESFIMEVDSLEETDRGSKGFGSSGV